MLTVSNQDTLQPDPALALPADGPVIDRILIVDDSGLQRRILSAQLRRLGYAVTEANSAEAALALCRDEPPDMVISDWMMQGMSGLDFCREFRAMRRDSYGYFILLTSKSEKADIARGLEGGADDFLTKPVHLAELRGRIAAGERVIRMERRLSESNKVISAALSELKNLYNSINNDLIAAKRFQQSLIRERCRSFGTADISLLLRSSGHVGGDLVGFFPINERRVGMFALDVAGHGIAPAMMTARLAAHLSGATPEQNVALVPSRSGTVDGRSPAEVAAILNRIAIEEMQAESYFTMAYADVDHTTGKVVAVQAGHPHPALQHADGRIEFVGRGGLPVGLFAEASYEQFELFLEPGDRLFIMSDGVTETQGRDGRQLGEAGVAGLMRRHAALSGPAFLEALVWDLALLSGDELADDVSGAFLEYRGPATRTPTPDHGP